MNKLIILLAIFTFLFSCKNIEPDNNKLTPKAKVKVTKIKEGYLPSYLKLTGKTVYLNKNNLVSPINGYITKVNVRQGDKVKKGKVLFEIQTTEAYIMNNKTNKSNNYGTIKIDAPVDGQLTDLKIVNGNVFTNSGNILCTILELNDLKLQINIPFEYNKFIKEGEKCIAILPDNTKIQATIVNILPQVDEVSQTEQVLAKLDTKQFIPENLILNVLIDKGSPARNQILPKSCLQTDALMSKYWVMKLINDSTAIRTFVKIGNQTHNKVEILKPIFKKDDLFISEGAYGLNNTVLIERY